LITGNPYVGNIQFPGFGKFSDGKKALNMGLYFYRFVGGMLAVKKVRK
jgi:hypothetical protein